CHPLSGLRHASRKHRTYSIDLAPNRSPNSSIEYAAAAGFVLRNSPRPNRQCENLLCFCHLHPLPSPHRFPVSPASRSRRNCEPTNEKRRLFLTKPCQSTSCYCTLSQTPLVEATLQC